MSIVDDQIRRLDALLDKFQIAAASKSSLLQAATDSSSTAGAPDSPRTLHLKSVIRALSTTSSSRPLLKKRRLRALLVQAISRKEVHVSSSTPVHEEDVDLEWLAAGKATIQVYGLIMNTFLEQTIPLSDGIWYWDDVLGSYAGTGLYTLQTWPARLWKQTKEVYMDAKEKYVSRTSIRDTSQQATRSLAEGWREFYGLVQDSIRDRSFIHARTRILSPFALCRTEARRKQTGLKRLREMSATAIGLLVDEGLTFQPFEEAEKSLHKVSSSPDLGKEEWRSTVAKSVSLLEHILRNVGTTEHSIADFEESVFTSVEGDPEIATTETREGGTITQPRVLTKRLLRILDQHLPKQELASEQLASDFGRPSRLVRYWMPGMILLLSGSTLLRILTNRRAEIKVWIQEFGQTVIDFWSNWVIEPIKNLIGTIRHDEKSEVAIMSKDSLKADRASLERMVVDFAVDHANETGLRYTETDIADIRAKVKEGDLTPVLRAYERDLQKPFIGTIRGDLVRALLIQIQKTKVDVEVAIDGIDALLKSQELLFGFVGIAPGVLISFAVFRWLGGLFGSRKGLRLNQKQGDTVRLLR